ncbi:MAG: hypothetical protein ABI210_07495 [Abditibacteriaceae bacterium]
MLRGQGFSKSADDIYMLLHKVCWTTSTELFEELRITFYNILRENRTLLSRELQEDIEQCAGVLEEALDTASRAMRHFIVKP